MLLASTALSCHRGRDENEIVGAYKLAALDEVSVDGTPHRADATGSLILTRDGRMSVHVMYRDSGSPPGGPVQYAQGGYEASFGRYEIDEQAHAFTYHVEGALVRSLIGKDMKRLYERNGMQLVVTPPTADEHWRVTWERY
ncbi:Hypothetical protein A7982_03891 [Minicystis rosea]|nr:Hypothetical protein A7982_03891 [Minicystis rosea]